MTDSLTPIRTRINFAVTADCTLSYRQCGDILVHNTGAAGTVIVTLPPVAPRLKARFLRSAAQTLTVDPNGTNAIFENGVSLGAGVAKSLTATGAYLELECDGTQWHVLFELPVVVGDIADDSVTAAKLADACIDDVAKLTAGLLAASTAGRAVMAADYFGTEAIVDDKFAVGTIDGDILKAGALSADATGRAIMAADFFGDEATVDAKFAAGVIDGDILKAGALSADATGRAIMAADFFDETTATAKFGDGSIATVLLKAANVTPPKMAFTGLKTITFAGRNGAGAITATGVLVGERVIAVWKFGDVSDNLTTVDGVVSQPNALFESAITVQDQLQQASATDLTDNKYMALVIPAAA